MGRRFGVDNVGLFIPAPRVVDKGCEDIIEDEGAVFHHGSQKRGASGTSIEPEKDWIGGWVILGGEEEVVHVGGVVVDVQVAGVPGLVVNRIDLGHVGGVGFYGSEG